MNLCIETLTHVLTRMLGTDVTRADYQTNQLHGGTVGEVRLVTGIAETADGERLPYKLVLKVQKKWVRQDDPHSWRREYDLYVSDFGTLFTDSLRWPKCYHAEMNSEETETQLWIEHIDGVSGYDLTVEMFERAAFELGRWQGKLYAEQPEILQSIQNLSRAGDLKAYYLYYRSYEKVYNYVRSETCEIPAHLCQMLIKVDEKADEIWKCIEALPVVLCHRDFWVTNIFHKEGEIILIDWDTTGWSYMGEDIKSLIADEADVNHMVEYYQRCVPAYYKGFSEYADVSHIADNCVWEMILVNLGYRLVDWFMDADSPEEKAIQIDTLQKICEMKEHNVNISLRLESTDDHHTVEALTREAFSDWKHKREGGGVCDEHLLVHKLRKDPVYVPELNYIAELDGQIVGHIIYSKAKIVGADGDAHEVLTFGPISVLPKYQKRGIGRALIEHTAAEAKRLGFAGILIHGHPEYYPRFGFKRARDFGLTPEHDACMAMELIPGALNIPGGHFTEAPVFFNLPQAEVDEFDKQFMNMNGKD